jgi:adenine deaminase
LTELTRLIAVAKGDEPADLVLADARVVNTFNGEVESGIISRPERCWI